MRVPAGLLLAIALPLLFCAAARAQTEPGTQRHEISFWGAASFSNGHAFGFAQNRTVQQAGVRYGRMFFQDGPLAFRYVIEAVPLTLVGEPHPGGGRAHIYGGGFSPIGVQVNLLRRRRVQPFLTSNGGVLYFSRPVPIPSASQFNFTVFIAGGAQFFLSDSRAFSIGYKYHHLSNANTIRENPGLDAHMIFAAFSLLR